MAILGVPWIGGVVGVGQLRGQAFAAFQAVAYGRAQDVVRAGDQDLHDGEAGDGAVERAQGLDVGREDGVRYGDHMRGDEPSALRDVPVTHDGAGPIDRSHNSLPLIDWLNRDHSIAYGVGWSGNGVDPSVVGGKTLASMAFGRDDEWANCGLVAAPRKHFPPDPVRYVGAHRCGRRSSVRNAQKP